MRSYNPENNRNTDPKELVKNFFETDLLVPDSFFAFKRDLMDYFSAKEEDRKIYRTYWLLSVYAYWNFLPQISTEESLYSLVKSIPDAARLGFNVFKEFIVYIKNKFFVVEEMQQYYSKIREQIINSEEPVGLPDSEMTLAKLCKDVELLNSYADDSIRAAEFYDQLQGVLFKGLESEFIYDYIDPDRGEAVKNLVNLVNFVINTEPKYIYPAAEAEEILFTTGIDPLNLKARIGVPPPDLDQVLELPAIKAIKIPELSEEVAEPKLAMRPDVVAEDLYKMFNVPFTEKTEISAPIAAEDKLASASQPKFEAPAPKFYSTEKKPSASATEAKPSYADIKAKVDSAFPKDKAGVYKDLDGVLMALAKAADKYKDPKIAELYYFDESSGSFKWNV